MTAVRRKSASEKMSPDASLRQHLIELLKGGNAHVGFLDALENIPKRKRGAYGKGLPHTAWQLLEHLRIAQRDILEFSRNPKHISPDFPAGYWPSTPAPHDDAGWNQSIRAFRRDQLAMMRLISNRRLDLHAPFPWGDGQTLLREALLVADHNAYHLAQLVDLRRALGIWPGS